MRARFFKILFIFVISLSAFSYYIVFSESGLRLGLRLASAYSSGKLIIGEAKGNLGSHFTLKNISFQNQQQIFTAKSLEIHWNPMSVLTGKLLIKKILLEDALLKIDSSQSHQNNSKWLTMLNVKQFSVSHFVIDDDKIKIQIDGDLTQQRWNARWQIASSDLQGILPELSGSLTSSGNIIGPLLQPIIHSELQANDLILRGQKIKKLQGTVAINLQPNSTSSIKLTGYDINCFQQLIPKMNIDLKGKFSLKDHRLNSSLFIILADKYQIKSHFALPHFTTINDFKQAITGEVQLDFTYLDFLTHWIPEIKKPTGKVHGQFIVNGQLNHPMFTSNLTLSDGAVSVPKFGVSLNKIQLNFTTDSLRNLLLEGHFQSGTGIGHVKGSYDLSQLKFPIGFQLTGDHLQIFKSKEYDINASPELSFIFNKQNLAIKGELFIPDAEITPINFENTVTLPNEVSFVKEEKLEETSLPYDLQMQVNVKLSNKIHVVYKDLETYITGQLHIQQNLNGPLTATGELLTVNGIYQAYGQSLKIQEGRIIYTGGSLLNPGLNIHAGKNVKILNDNLFKPQWDHPSIIPAYASSDSIFVGVLIDGTFDHYKISLYSNPNTLSQKEILSYLALGHSTANQNSALLSATSALGWSKKTRLTQAKEKLKNKLGLTELEVDNTEIFNPISGKISSSPALMLGKEITPNLYAHYSKTLLDSMQTLNLRYKLSKRFSIQSETSTIGAGADLLYSIERD